MGGRVGKFTRPVPFRRNDPALRIDDDSAHRHFPAQGCGTGLIKRLGYVTKKGRHDMLVTTPPERRKMWKEMLSLGGFRA